MNYDEHFPAYLASKKFMARSSYFAKKISQPWAGGAIKAGFNTFLTMIY